MSLAGLLPSVAKVIRHNVPERQLGKVLGYAQSSQYAGQVIGPLMGGAIGAHLGMRPVFVATSAMTLMGAAGNWLCLRLVHKHNEKNAAVDSVNAMISVAVLNAGTRSERGRSTSPGANRLRSACMDRLDRPRTK
jgi:MFS family permease